MAAGKVLLIILAFSMSLMHGKPGRLSTLSPGPQSASSEKGHNMKITINVGGKTLAATLVDNATAKDFASVLPLTMSMKDLSGREKYAKLPKALSEKAPRKQRYELGEIAYWSPSHDLAIYYHQDGESIPSPGIIPIARIDRGVEAFNVSGSVKVVIELAK